MNKNFVRNKEGKFTAIPLKERFYRFISVPENENLCWLWRGSFMTKNQPQFSIGKKNFIASRVSYEIHKGEVPQGMLVCHTCDNPRCVNPDHLFLGTHKDNVQDMINKNRRFKLQLGGKPPITKELIASIRLALANKIKKTVIKSRYNVCISTIRNIEMCRGRYKNESN